MLLQKAQEILQKQASLVDLDIACDSKITVCGDTHGQYLPLTHYINIFQILRPNQHLQTERLPLLRQPVPVQRRLRRQVPN